MSAAEELKLDRKEKKGEHVRKSERLQIKRGCIPNS